MREGHTNVNRQRRPDRHRQRCRNAQSQSQIDANKIHKRGTDTDMRRRDTQTDPRWTVTSAVGKALGMQLSPPSFAVIRIALRNSADDECSKNPTLGSKICFGFCGRCPIFLGATGQRLQFWALDSPVGMAGTLKAKQVSKQRPESRSNIKTKWPKGNRQRRDAKTLIYPPR